MKPMEISDQSVLKTSKEHMDAPELLAILARKKLVVLLETFTTEDEFSCDGGN